MRIFTAIDLLDREARSATADGWQRMAGTPLRVLFLATLVLRVPAALAQDTSEIDAPPPPPVIAPVLSVHATLNSPSTVVPTCWQVLITERDYLIREDNARPWLLRNIVPLAGTAMGGITGSLLLRKHTAAATARKWAIPAFLTGAAAGFIIGPGGVAGFAIGGAIGEKLGKQKLAITIGSAIGGALAGKALWEMVFPPAVPDAPGNQPDDDIPVEVFLKDKVCGTRLQVAHQQSAYRVAYRFGQEERFAELPYDPGEALLVGASGEVLGPARRRLD